VKGLAAGCLICSRGAAFIQSGEDLSNIGPVALLQDLAVVSTLASSTRSENGHHYFRGASGFDDVVGQAMIEHHPDLYHRVNDLVTLHH